MKRLQAEQDAAAGRTPAFGGPRHHDLLLIQHRTRHSDLRLHTYRPRAVDAAAEEDGGFAWVLPLASRVASLEGLERRPARRSAGGATAASESGALEDWGSLVRMNPLSVLEAEDLAQVGARVRAGAWWVAVQRGPSGGPHNAGPCCRAALVLDVPCHTHHPGTNVAIVAPLAQGCFPPEMGLEPADVEQLYDAMAAAAAAAPEGPWRAQVRCSAQPPRAAAPAAAPAAAHSSAGADKTASLAPLAAP